MKHPDVRKAVRFFKERRVEFHFVDFKVRGPSPGELKRFVQKFGVANLVDRNSRRFSELGLGSSRYSDRQWLDKLVDEPLLLTLPLVRYDKRLSVGPCQQEWREWTETDTSH